MNITKTTISKKSREHTLRYGLTHKSYQKSFQQLLSINLDKNMKENTKDRHADKEMQQLEDLVIELGNYDYCFQDQDILVKMKDEQDLSDKNGEYRISSPMLLLSERFEDDGSSPPPPSLHRSSRRLAQPGAIHVRGPGLDDSPRVHDRHDQNVDEIPQTPLVNAELVRPHDYDSDNESGIVDGCHAEVFHATPLEDVEERLETTEQSVKETEKLQTMRILLPMLVIIIIALIIGLVVGLKSIPTSSSGDEKHGEASSQD